jgi:hypothetical protein
LLGGTATFNDLAMGRNTILLTLRRDLCII